MEDKKLFISKWSDRIKKAVTESGPYWNQLVTTSLQAVAKQYGTKEANKLITKHKLERHGFSKVI
jgi:hypothetical protein